MLTPGANKSRTEPKLEKVARVSALSVAPTVMAAQEVTWSTKATFTLPGRAHVPKLVSAAAFPVLQLMRNSG